MKYFITTIIILTSLVGANAQSFEKAFGVRLGYSNALFFEKQNKDLTSSRYMLNWREGGRQVTAMKVFRRYDLDEYSEFKLEHWTGQLSFYYGYGVHVGYIKWNQSITDDKGHYFQSKSAPVFGLDGLVGLSYDFDRLPFSITLDAKPFYDFWGRRFFKIAPQDIAIGVVYIF